MVRTVSVAPFLDLNADTLGATGTAVSTWSDSVASRAFLQATSTAQPAVVAGPGSGHKGVQFTPSRFLRSELQGAPTRTAITITFVLRIDATSSIPRLGIISAVASDTNNDYSSPGWNLAHPTVANETAASGLTSGGGISNNADTRVKSSSQPFGTWVIVTGQVGPDGQVGQWYTNGTAEPLTAPASTLAALSFVVLYLGARRYGNTMNDYARYSLTRLMIYPGRLSAADRAAMHSNLSDAYGITVADYVADGPPKATGSGTWATTGTAAGKRAPAASAAGAWAVAGVAAGKRNPIANGSGTWTTTGSAAAKSSPTASAAGAWAFTGQATAQRVAKATAAGQTAWAGQAQGVRSPKATATGATAWAGTATGYAAPVAPPNGTAAGTCTTAGAATGRRNPQATALGALTWTGTAVGYTPSGAPPDHLPGAATLTNSVGNAALAFSPSLASLAAQPATATLIAAAGTATIDLT